MAKRLTYPEKTNNPSDDDSIRKFHAFEANEIKDVADDHATEIEQLKANQPTSQNPYYGRYTSLILLQAAQTTAEEFGWAIIDEAPGVSPKIALWNTVGETWEISGASDDKVFVANEASLPAPGIEGKWYITLDKAELFLWFNSQYNKISGGSSSNQVAKYQLSTSEEGQLEFTVPGQPNNIVLIKNGGVLTEGVLFQYTYSSTTSKFTLNENKPAKITDKFEVIALGVNATKQSVIADEEGQTEFVFSGNPGTILVFINQGWQTEDLQYTRTFYNSNNKIITSPKSIGTLAEIIKIF